MLYKKGDEVINRTNFKLYIEDVKPKTNSYMVSSAEDSWAEDKIDNDKIFEISAEEILCLTDDWDGEDSSLQ